MCAGCVLLRALVCILIVSEVESFYLSSISEVLNSSHEPKLSELLLPAAAEYSALASEFDIDFDLQREKEFDIMLHKLVDRKQVTQRQLADALRNPQVQHNQLADKLLEYDLGEL